MGHPDKDGPLEELCEEEEKRRQLYIAGVDQHTKDLQVHNNTHLHVITLYGEGEVFKSIVQD